MEIALWGYYGSNYGDDIMLEVLLDYFEDNNVKVLLIQQYNEHLEYKLDKKYKNVSVIPFQNFSRKEKLVTILKLSKVQINLWGGGTIFTDQEGDGNYKFFRLIKLFGGKIGYIGVGIGKLSKQNRIKKTKKLLKWSSLTIFRDEISYKKAKKLVENKNYLIAEDLSYIYFQRYKRNKENINGNYLLLSWRNLSGYLPLQHELQLMKDTIDVIINIMDRRKITRVKLIALDTKRDIESCRLLTKLFKKVNIDVEFDIDSSVSNITNLIINSSIHFSGRLHGSIASEYFDVSTISLAYSPKIKYFYNSIDSINYIDIYNDKLNLGIVEKRLHDNSNFINIDQKYNEAKLTYDYLEAILKLGK